MERKQLNPSSQGRRSFVLKHSLGFPCTYKSSGFIASVQKVRAPMVGNPLLQFKTCSSCFASTFFFQRFILGLVSGDTPLLRPKLVRAVCSSLKVWKLGQIKLGAVELYGVIHSLLPPEDPPPNKKIGNNRRIVMQGFFEFTKSIWLKQLLSLNGLRWSEFSGYLIAYIRQSRDRICPY